MMSQDRLMKVLLAPVVSEKSTMVGEKHGQVVFRVVPDRSLLRQKGQSMLSGPSLPCGHRDKSILYYIGRQIL